VQTDQLVDNMGQGQKQGQSFTWSEEDDEGR
jgi:hypothetical protein